MRRTVYFRNPSTKRWLYFTTCHKPGETRQAVILLKDQGYQVRVTS